MNIKELIHKNIRKRITPDNDMVKLTADGFLINSIDDFVDIMEEVIIEFIQKTTIKELNTT